MAVRVVFFVLHGCSTGALAFLTTYRPSPSPNILLVLNSTRLYPSRLSCLLFNSSALYYLQTPTRWYRHASTPPQLLPISGDRDVSLPLSLEWPVWSSSSGNKSSSSEVTLFRCASLWEYNGIFFYLVPFHQPISAHTISSHNCH